MVKFVKKVTKLALKSAAVCTGIAAGVALLHKYVKIQSNCSECGPKEDNFDEDLDEDTTKPTEEVKESEASDEESDAISSDEATDSSSRRYINIHVTSKNNDVDINIDKGKLVDDAAKLVSDAAQLTKKLRPGSHEEKEEKAEATEEKKEETDTTHHLHFKSMNANNDIADLDIEDLGVDIDEDLSEGVSDLYAMDGVTEEEAEETIVGKDEADHAEDSKPEEAPATDSEEKTEEAPVNSSIHL